jgi:subfamily B ATP-binding cassette protein MsbA
VALVASARLSGEHAPLKRANPFFRLLDYARPYRGRLFCALLAMIVYGAASAGVLLQVRPILDEVLPRHTDLVRTIAAILGFYFLKGLGAYLSDYLMTDIGQRVVRDLRSLLFRHILGQSAAFFSSQTTGKLMSRITNDVGQVQRAVSETIGDLTRESLSLVGFAWLLFYYDARLALVCLTGAPLIVYPLVRLGQRVRRTSRRSQEALAQMSHTSASSRRSARKGANRRSSRPPRRISTSPP